MIIVVFRNILAPAGFSIFESANLIVDECDQRPRGLANIVVLSEYFFSVREYLWIRFETDYFLISQIVPGADFYEFQS